MEELVKFMLLIRDQSDYLIDRYSERKGIAAQAARLVEEVMHTHSASWQRTVVPV